MAIFKSIFTFGVLTATLCTMVVSSLAAPVEKERRFLIVAKGDDDAKNLFTKKGFNLRRKIGKFVVADLTDKTYKELKKAQKNLEFYEDMPVKMVDVQPNPPNWGIDRIDERDLPLDLQYVYPAAAGASANVYVLDTGIRTTHSEFSGRAIFAANFHGDGIDGDCNGHGTHVASTVGGETTGVAKDSNIFGVKVLGCDGSGFFSSVIAGIQYVIDQHNASANKKTIINMSLIGGKFQPVDDMVANAVNAGITVVVAAGNSNDNACNYSPASAPLAITAAASVIDDSKAGFSNFGTCVDLYAPGQDILGAGISSDTAFVSFSGTSMASPHIAGVAALYQSTGSTLTPSEIHEKLVADSTKNVIKGNPTGTPNRLLFVDNPTSPPPPPSDCIYTIPTFDGIKKYCVLQAKTNANAITSCSALGGNLADVSDTSEFGYLSSRVTKKAWMRSWQGNTYGNSCLVFWPGGAITQASCGELNEVLCEVNV